MKLLKKWFIKQLSKKAKPFLQSYGLLKTAQIFHRSTFVWEPEGSRVLVLSPHFDDEIIGCGGALYKHILGNAEVTIVYMTDGRYGGILEDFPEYTGERKELKLMEIRKNEAKNALKLLGIKEGIFLDAKECNLTSTKEIRIKIRQIIDRIKPEFVYLPFFLEEHPDHRMTSQILFDATEDINFQFDCLGYEIWTPLFPNCYVDIGDVIEMKRLALKQYTSQLADTNFIHTALGLNAYRSSALTCRTQFAEAYFMASLDNYRKLYKSYNLNFRSITN